jgi:hypothetical protein
LKHHLHPEVCEPGFERFQNPDVAEPFMFIGLPTQVSLATIYCWQEGFRLPPDWRPNRHQALLNRRIFTKGEETEIPDYVTEHFICCRVRYPGNHPYYHECQMPRHSAGVTEEGRGLEDELYMHATLSCKF